MLNKDQLLNHLNEFLKLPAETEYLEFKTADNNFDTHEIWKYFSALSNESYLKHKDCWWLIFWINDKHNIVWTNYRENRARLDSLKKQIANETSWWLSFVEIYELYYDDKRVIMFQIPPAINWQITKRKWFAYGRDWESLWPLNEYETEIISKPKDWSSNVILWLWTDILDPIAIKKARELFYEKNKAKFSQDEVNSWDNITFLNKAKITIQWNITNATIILLWKEESSSFISPSVSQISWILYNEKWDKIDYEHFWCPFLLNIEKVYQKIRNLNYRYISDNTLFPVEITKYDPWVIREALNNAIAHEDYSMNSRIVLEEKSDELIISNAWSFIPWNIENVIKDNSPEKYYRNKFLVDAMVNLNMIDTIWSWIIKMFNKQKERYFPLPDFDLSNTKEVKLTISWRIIDEKYTKLLMKNKDISLNNVILLDKIQKWQKISLIESRLLRKEWLIDWKYPKIFISLEVSQQINEVSNYVKNKVNKEHYERLIINFIKNNKWKASRKQINEVLIDKLSNIYDNDKKKIKKIWNILNEMRAKWVIKNIWNNKYPTWIIL